jgi:hypothetical protein
MRLPIPTPLVKQAGSAGGTEASARLRRGGTSAGPAAPEARVGVSRFECLRIVRDAMLPRDMKQRAKAKSVLMLLALRADEDGSNAWPAVATLAANSCMGTRTVDKMLTQLESRGFISEQAAPR